MQGYAGLRPEMPRVCARCDEALPFSSPMSRVIFSSPNRACVHFVISINPQEESKDVSQTFLTSASEWRLHSLGSRRIEAAESFLSSPYAVDLLHDYVFCLA